MLLSVCRFVFDVVDLSLWYCNRCGVCRCDVDVAVVVGDGLVVLRLRFLLLVHVVR